MRKYLFLTVCIFSIYVYFSCKENELFELSPNLEASNYSYEDQFKAVWSAVDMNYPIWDYERDEYGLNWDDVYDEYLPKFREQDLKYKETKDTVCWLNVQALYNSLFNKLHDGHICFKIKDVYTGKEASLMNAINILQAYIYALSYVIYTIKLENYKKENSSGYLLLDVKRSSNGFYQFAHFQGDIVYLHFLNFDLSSLLAKANRTSDEQSVVDVWQTWFDKIQDLHYNNKLKGVILDVRTNLGGNAIDYKYFLGALHDDIDGSGGVQTGYYRMKSGIGRYDYVNNVMINGDNCTYHPYEGKHVNVTAPIVVLADSMSASMAEQTCLAAKKIPNAYVIGTQTCGAFSPLADGEVVDNDNHFTKWGNIGDPKLETSSFYIKMPFAAFVSHDGRILEGKGVEPDKQVFNNDIYRDMQLEYALEFISNLNNGRH